VPTAIPFDLAFGNPAVRPDKGLGYQACQNAHSDVVPEGSVGAGTGATIGKLFSVLQATKGGLGYAAATLGVILANARLDKADAQKLAQLGQNALARVIAPVHTLYDGDIIFALSVGQVEAGLMQVGIVAQEMLQEAIFRAVKAADDLCRLPAWRDLQ